MVGIDEGHRFILGTPVTPNGLPETAAYLRNGIVFEP
jgi:hypothetical protein